MNRTNNRFMKMSLAGLVDLACLFANERASLTSPGALLSTAEARIGRPLTPMSYAGVARRTTRRAVAVGAVGYGAAAYGAPRGACTQVVDAYGRIVTRCY
jgi:hypothetical protein